MDSLRNVAGVQLHRPGRCSGGQAAGAISTGYLEPTMSEYPTREQCINEFWEIIGPALVDLMREGKIDPEQYRRLPKPE